MHALLPAAPRRLAPVARWGARLAPVLLTAVFLAVAAWMTAQHEMWRDEMQAWLLARDAATPLDVIRNTRYEGHPWLWHLLLWVPARFTWNPVAMQVVHLLLAGGTVFVILRWAPFPPLVRLLLVGGYFFAYEWAVIARNYAASTLFFSVFATLYAHRWRNAPWMGLALAGAALTNIHSIILVLALAPALAIEYAVAHAGDFRGARAALPRALLGLALALAGLGLGIRAAKPPEDTGFAVDWHFEWSDARYAEAADRVIRAYVPLPVDQSGFWNTNRLLAEGARPAEERPWWAVAPERRTRVAWGILLAGALLMFRRPWPIVPYLAGSVGLVAFFYIKLMGAMRHHGFLFLAFVIALWMSRHLKPWRLPWPRLDAVPAIAERALLWALAPLLALHVWGTAVAMRQDRAHVFSQGRAAAFHLRERYPDPEAVAWAGHASPMATTVVGYLQLPRMFYLDRNAYGSFVIWDRARRWRDGEGGILQRLRAFQAQERKPVVFVSSRRLSTRSTRRGLRLVESFEGAISGESFYLYEWPWTEDEGG